MTGMNLLSLQMQRDCAMSVTEARGGMRFTLFSYCDLDFDLDLMTLIYKLDLKILKMCVYVDQRLKAFRS